MTDDPQARLQAARQRQTATRERIENLATNSITAWLSQILRRVVGRAVRSIADWFVRLFTSGTPKPAR